MKLVQRLDFDDMDFSRYSVDRRILNIIRCLPCATLSALKFVGLELTPEQRKKVVYNSIAEICAIYSSSNLAVEDRDIAELLSASIRRSGDKEMLEIFTDDYISFTVHLDRLAAPKPQLMDFLDEDNDTWTQGKRK